MTDKEYNKMIADVRRGVSRKYGFRQSSYVNFKVESGYFFCLYFLTGDVRLTVFPAFMISDFWMEDLRWALCKMEEKCWKIV